MKAPRLGPGIAFFAIAALLLTASTSAFADSYQIFNLTSGARTSFVGVTASGTVVLNYHFYNACSAGPFPASCYETWVNGVMIHQSVTAPDFVYDNGTGCLADTNFTTYFAAGVCNSGREVYWASFSTSPYTGIFTGPDLGDLFTAGYDEVYALNSSGDFVYLANSPPASGEPGEWVEAIDLTTSETPEPSSIFLLGTGLLAGLGTMRRRLFQV